MATQVKSAPATIDGTVVVSNAGAELAWDDTGYLATENDEGIGIGL